MFERFTERARQVVVLAQEEARTAGRDRIDSVAILLGLLREEEGLGAQVLQAFGVDAKAVREAWAHMDTESGPAKDKDSVQLPFTHHAKAILENALREALSLGHCYIGTEHVLLGLMRRDESNAVAYLDAFGAAGAIRPAVISRLAGPRAKPATDYTQRIAAPYQTPERVQAWLVDIAAELTRVVKGTDHFGTATFSALDERVEVSRSARGITVSFLARPA